MNDQDLRRRFDALRHAELSAAPPFKLSPRLRVPASPRLRLRWRRLAAAAVLLILISAPFAVRRWSSPKHEASLTTWKAPTDFLLDTPGNELLRSVPQLGSSAVADSLKGVPQ